MVITLADNSPFTLSAAGTRKSPYIYLPDMTGKTAGSYVREDYFDELKPDEFREFMKFLAPYQPAVRSGLSEGMFLSAIGKKRQARKAAKAAKKDERKDKRLESRNAIRAARAGAIERGEGFDWNGLVSSVGGIARTASQFIPGASAVSGIMGMIPGQPAAPGAAPVAIPEATKEPFLEQTNFTGFTNKQTLIGAAAAALGYKLLKG